jgi:hypothetical protein
MSGRAEKHPGRLAVEALRSVTKMKRISAPGAPAPAVPLLADPVANKRVAWARLVLHAALNVGVNAGTPPSSSGNAALALQASRHARGWYELAVEPAVESPPTPSMVIELAGTTADSASCSTWRRAHPATATEIWLSAGASNACGASVMDVTSESAAAQAGATMEDGGDDDSTARVASSGSHGPAGVALELGVRAGVPLPDADAEAVVVGDGVPVGDNVGVQVCDGVSERVTLALAVIDAVALTGLAVSDGDALAVALTEAVGVGDGTKSGSDDISTTVNVAGFEPRASRARFSVASCSAMLMSTRPPLAKEMLPSTIGSGPAMYSFASQGQRELATPQ